MTLNRETLRTLDRIQLGGIAGGIPTQGPCGSNGCPSEGNTWSDCYISACEDCVSYDVSCPSHSCP
jgi:hypothetical protein